MSRSSRRGRRGQPDRERAGACRATRSAPAFERPPTRGRRERRCRPPSSARRSRSRRGARASRSETRARRARRSATARRRPVVGRPCRAAASATQLAEEVRARLAGRARRVARSTCMSRDCGAQLRAGKPGDEVAARRRRPANASRLGERERASRGVAQRQLGHDVAARRGLGDERRRARRRRRRAGRRAARRRRAATTGAPPAAAARGRARRAPFARSTTTSWPASLKHARAAGRRRRARLKLRPLQRAPRAAVGVTRAAPRRRAGRAVPLRPSA